MNVSRSYLPCHPIPTQQNERAQKRNKLLTNREHHGSQTFRCGICRKLGGSKELPVAAANEADWGWWLDVIAHEKTHSVHMRFEAYSRQNAAKRS